MRTLVYAAIVACGVLPFSLCAKQLTEEDLKSAIAAAGPFKSQSEMLNDGLAKHKITRRNWVNATREIYILTPWARVALACVAAKTKIENFSLEDARKAAMNDGVGVLLESSPWGAAGIAKTIQDLRLSTLLLESDSGPIKPSVRWFWVGDVSNGPPIYYFESYSRGNFSVAFVTPLSQIYAHGHVYLFGGFDVPEAMRKKPVRLSIFKAGGKKKVVDINLSKYR